MADIGKALQLRRLWLALAVEDVTDAHRRTTLGPAWLLVNYLLMVGTFTLIFSQMMSSANYIAFVAIGLLVWNYIAEAISMGTGVFVREEAMIKGTVLPLSTYVFKLLAQSLIRFGYALAGCLVVLLVSGEMPRLSWLYALPGLLLLILATPPVVVIMGLLGAVNRDVQFIVSNLLRIGMFISPVIWVRSQTGILHWLSVGNPVTYFLEIVREPVVAGNFPGIALGIVAAATLVLWLVAVPLLGAMRNRVVFYL